MKIQRHDIIFVVGVSLFYCALSASFSLVSIFFADRTTLPNPLEHEVFRLNIKEIVGHFIWGAVAGVVTLRLRYIILAGSIAVLIDSDHLVNLLQFGGIPRMGHSIAFAIIATIVLMIIFSRKDYRLGAIVGTSILTHISFDLFYSESGFPIFTPFVNTLIQIPNADWLVFEIAAICIVGIVSYIVTRRESEKIIKNDSGREC